MLSKIYDMNRKIIYENSKWNNSSNGKSKQLQAMEGVIIKKTFIYE